MSREIQFRAAYNGTVYDVTEIMWSDQTVYIVERENGENGETVDIDKVELLQFTGLKDKNGKEIYEGDILGGHNPKYDKDGGAPSIVKWNEEEACFAIFRGKTSSGYFLSAEVKWNEVAGNIHENQQLLT